MDVFIPFYGESLLEKSFTFIINDSHCEYFTETTRSIEKMAIKKGRNCSLVFEA